MLPTSAIRLPTSDFLDRACQRFRRSLAAALFADGALRGLTVAAAAWGVAALVTRVVAGNVPATLGWLSLLLPTASVAAGLLQVARRLPSTPQARIALDKHTCAGGLIVTADAPGYEAWTERTPAPSVPLVTRNNRSQHAAALAALLFAAATAWIPDRASPPAGPLALDVRNTLDLLADQTEALAEEELIEPDVAATFERQLEQLWKQASGDDPARTYEALEHLAAALREEATLAAETLIERAERLATFEALANLLAEVARDPDHNAEALRQALGELAQTLEANPALANLAAALGNALPDLLQAANLTPSQLAELARQLGQCQNATQSTMAALCEARLLSPEALRKCRAAGACPATVEAAKAALLDYLAANPGTDANALLAACTTPGSGGIDRGGGPSAGLTWTQETTADGATFVEQALPPAPGELATSQLVGHSAAAPEASGDDGPSDQGALAGSAAAPGEAWRRTLLPRHRGPVERYFDRGP